MPSAGIPLGIIAAATPAAGGGGGSFDPLTSVSWLRVYWANDPSWTNPGDGNGVSSWRDASGNSDHAVQATGANQPLFRSAVAAINNRGGIDFDGVNDYLASGSSEALHAQPFSLVMVVASWAKIRSFDNPIFGTNGTDCRFNRGYPGTEEVALYAGGADYSGTNRGDGNAHLYTAVFNGSSSTIGIDGSVQTISTNGANPGTAGFQYGVSIGAQGNTAFPSDVTIAFCGVYIGDFTAHTNYAAFKSWVQSYYGITVS